MVRDAVNAVDLPQPEPLPDIGQMVRDAVATMPLPDAPVPLPLPDISAMVRDAVNAIELPQPEPLPDISQMVRDAVAAIPAATDGKPGDDGRDALQIEILRSSKQKILSSRYLCLTPWRPVALIPENNRHERLGMCGGRD